MGGALRCAALPFASPKQNEPAVLRPDCTEPRRYIGATLRVKLGRRVASDLPATRPAEQRSAQRTNRFSPASRRTFHTRTRMAAGTKNARRVPIGRRRMSRAEGGTDRRSSRPLTPGWSDLCRRLLYVPKRRAPSVPLRFFYRPELAVSGRSASEKLGTETDARRSAADARPTSWRWVKAALSASRNRSTRRTGAARDPLCPQRSVSELKGDHRSDPVQTA